jgi:hypothetical protein
MPLRSGTHSLRGPSKPGWRQTGVSTQTGRERSGSGLPRSCSACCLLRYEVISGRIIHTAAQFTDARLLYTLAGNRCRVQSQSRNVLGLKPSRNSRLDSLPALPWFTTRQRLRIGHRLMAAQVAMRTQVLASVRPSGCSCRATTTGSMSYAAHLILSSRRVITPIYIPPEKREEKLDRGALGGPRSQ